MSKSKKKKQPKIDLAVLARPRLDALLTAYASQSDKVALESGVRRLLTGVGEKPALDALIARLEGTPEPERAALLELVPLFKSPEVVDALWSRVKQPGGVSVGAKSAALQLLRALGELVDEANPTLYVSVRDLKSASLKNPGELKRVGVVGLARIVRDTHDSAEIEKYMYELRQVARPAGDARPLLLSLVAQAEALKNELGADLLYTFAFTIPEPEVRQVAEGALARLEAENVRPVTPQVLDLGREHFYAAYSSDPRHPYQQEVVVGWQKASGQIQALGFLLDFAKPWSGAIKDILLTRELTPAQFERQFRDDMERDLGERVFRISLMRAQAVVGDALQANAANTITLPKEFHEWRHLIDRWALTPTAAELERATEDELPELPLHVAHAGESVYVSNEPVDLNDPALRAWMAEQGTRLDPQTMTEDEVAEAERAFERAEYPPAVKQLLELGEPHGGENYREEGVTEEHIPDLVRLAGDREVSNLSSLSSLVWGPVHAVRALGQLGATQTSGALTPLLRYIDEDNDDWLGEEVSDTLAQFGALALPALQSFLMDSRYPLYARGMASETIKNIGEEQKTARAEAVRILTQALDQFAENDPTLNEFLIGDLLNLEAKESAESIQRAFAAGRVNESIAGDWEEAQYALGLGPKPKKKRTGFLDFLNDLRKSDRK